jgi:hypothetical protein
VAFFRYNRADRVGAPNPLLEPTGELPKFALAFGHSQSGRLLNAMIHGGFLADGRGRGIFDGVYVNVAGAGKGSFNHRFAQASRHFSPDIELDFPTDWFPFSTAPDTDPVAEATASLLDRARGKGPLPKMFIVNSAAEYWARSASLVHTTVDGLNDLAPSAEARVYFIAGGQHNPGRGGDRGMFAACRNSLDYRPMMRALLLQLDAWATLGRAPEPSAYPQLSDNALGSLSQYTDAYPKFAVMRLPTRLLEPPRLDFGPRFAAEGVAEIIPPKAGAPYAARVPLPDQDGLDRAGLRMPDIQVPLGTYTGWNLQNAATGAPERLGRWDGSFFPFARDENERLAAGDPRSSIAERYASRDSYVEAYTAATVALAEKELILAMDVGPMIERAGRFYDRIMAHAPEDEDCDYINGGATREATASPGTAPPRPPGR